MLWGYEITDAHGCVLGDEGDCAFRNKEDAFLDALSFAQEIVQSEDIGSRINIELQPVDENYVNWIK